MLIEVKNISKTYKTKISLIRSHNESIKAVDNVSFNVDNNEIMGLVGESGCGKSTLSRLIIGLEKTETGSIKFMGRDINEFKGKTMKNFRKNCQLIFQDTLTSLNPNMKILETMMEPLDNYYKISKDEKLGKINEILSFADLDEELLSKYPLEISGGERQRINICRALLLKPAFLICDEIISSLDVCTQAAILNMIKRIKKSNKMGILFISHDISAVKYLCSKIMVMYKGKIVETIDNENINYTIQHPYTKLLISSVPVRNPKDRALVSGFQNLQVIP